MNWFSRSALFVLVLVIPATAAEPVWERLNQHFFQRSDAAGKVYGHDALDPLLWAETKYLLHGESHARAIRLLDEFLALPAEALPASAWQRALLQRDLWAVFDWVAQPDASPERRQLQEKLARVLHRLRLSAADRAALPDNYAAAVRAGKFPRLPVRMFDRDSSWVMLGRNGSSVAAPVHANHFGARSVFAVLVRLPEGRAAGIKFIKELAGAPVDNSPPMPAGAEWALVRRMLVLGDDGKIYSSPVTESIQVRRYPGQPNVQEVAEFIMSRTSSGALRPVANDETEFVQFLSHGYDPFENEHGSVRPIVTLDSCQSCHTTPERGKELRSVLSYSRVFEGRYAEPPPVSDLSFDREVKLTRGIKYDRFDWGLLNGLWRRP